MYYNVCVRACVRARVRACVCVSVLSAVRWSIRSALPAERLCSATDATPAHRYNVISLIWWGSWPMVCMGVYEPA